MRLGAHGLKALTFRQGLRFQDWLWILVWARVLQTAWAQIANNFRLFRHNVAMGMA